MDKIFSILHKWYTKIISARLGAYGKGCYFIAFSKFFIPQNIFLGENVFINQQCIIAADEKITIGDNVNIGFRCMLLTSNYELYPNPISNRRTRYYEPIIIEKNVWLGAGAIILPGIKVGEGSVVAAGAVVTKDVPPYTLVGEVPARIIRKMDIQDTHVTIKKFLYNRVPAHKT